MPPCWRGSGRRSGGGRCRMPRSSSANSSPTRPSTRPARAPCAWSCCPARARCALTVTDTSPEPPRRHPPDPRRVGGHGLHLVAMLSRGLEVTWLSRGKRVSATVPLGPAAAD
ncbi:hypothetical protein LT493_31810 [Streptomyces tricolor]|nr:hypothetical protein [Streptomyces tricolor]